MTAALKGGEWSAARPGRTLPTGKTKYPFYRRLGGPQGRSGWTENLVHTGNRSRTVQPVVSRYTDWATGPTDVYKYAQKITNIMLWIGMNNTDLHQTSIEWCSQITVTRTDFLRTSSVCLTCRETLPNCQENWSSFFCGFVLLCGHMILLLGAAAIPLSWLSFHLTLRSTTSIIQITSLVKPHSQ